MKPWNFECIDGRFDTTDIIRTSKCTRAQIEAAGLEKNTQKNQFINQPHKDNICN